MPGLTTCTKKINMTYRIAIDVGHASRTGAITAFADEHEESALNAAELKRILESYKVDKFEVTIIDFPTKNNREDLNATVHAVNARDYHALVSLHVDWSTNSKARGAHVCYNRTYSSGGAHRDSIDGKRLAKEIAERLCPWLPGRADTIQPRADRSKGLSSLKILRDTIPPAVLIECGFSTNKADMDILKNNRHECMRAVALGIAAACNQFIKD